MGIQLPIGLKSFVFEFFEKSYPEKNFKLFHPHRTPILRGLEIIFFVLQFQVLGYQNSYSTTQNLFNHVRHDPYILLWNCGFFTPVNGNPDLIPLYVLIVISYELL